MLKTAILTAFVGILGIVLQANAQDDAASRLCLGVLQVDIKDTNHVLAEQDQFDEFQNILKTANFRSYQELNSQGGGIGLNIPLLKAVVGFTADAESDSGVFQREMSDFLSKSYHQQAGRSRIESSTSQTNSQLLSVAQNCYDKYFETLKDRIRLSVEVVPQSYSEFVIKLSASTPQTIRERFRIDQIEPTNSVSCTESGKAVSLGIERPDNQAVISCFKDEGRRIALVLRTNLGSPMVQLPAKPKEKQLCKLAQGTSVTDPQTMEPVDIFLNGEKLGYYVDLTDHSKSFPPLDMRLGYRGEPIDINRKFLTFDCVDEHKEAELKFDWKVKGVPKSCSVTAKRGSASNDVILFEVGPLVFDRSWGSFQENEVAPRVEAAPKVEQCRAYWFSWSLLKSTGQLSR